MVISPALCRAGRALLSWSQAHLAETAKLGLSTVRSFEGEAHTPTRANLAAIQSALESAGVEFTNGDAPGVRLKDSR